MYKITTLGKTEINDKSFYGSETRNYGIRGYEEIIGYAAKFNVDIETAGDVFGLSDEQKDLVKLMQARDLYKNGLIKQGNVLLNRVEETRGKTEEVNEALREIRSKKNLYQYRELEKPKILAFVKPGRRFNSVDKK